MYVAIRRYSNIEPKNVDEIVRRVRDGFVPIISRVNGFVGYRIVRAENGGLVTTSMYEDRTGADESVAAAADWVKANIATLVPEPPTVVEGEVKLRILDVQVPANYAVMREYKVNPRDLEEIVRRVDSGFVPILRSAAELAAYAIVDAGDGRVISRSAFRDAAAADASTQRAADWVRDNLGPLVPVAPTVTRGQILLNHVASPSAAAANANPQP